MNKVPFPPWGPYSEQKKQLILSAVDISGGGIVGAAERGALLAAWPWGKERARECARCVREH